MGMTRARLFVGVLLGMASMAAFAACGGDDLSEGEDTDSGANLVDGGVIDGAVDTGATDAGRDTGSVTDASSSATDASDSAVDAGPPGLITLHVAAWDDRELVPYESAVVVFYDPDGTPHAPIVSEDGGVTTATILPHSSVTVSMPEQTVSVPPTDMVDLITYIDINPGEEITIAGLRETDPPPPRDFGATLVLAPSGDAGAFADQHEVGNGCASAEFLASRYLSTSDACVDAGEVSVLTMARIDKTFTAFAQDSVPYVDGGATVDAWSWAPTTATPFIVNGVLSSEGTVVFVQAALRGGTTAFLDEIDGFEFQPAITDGGVALNIGLPPSGVVDNLAYGLLLDSQTRNVFATNDLASGLSLSASELLPKVHDASVSFDTTARTATTTFVADGALSSANGVVIRASWANGSTGYDWVTVAPAATHVVTPPLTSDLVGGHFPDGTHPLTFFGLTVESVSTASTYGDFLAVFPLYDPRRLNHHLLPATPVRVRTSKTP